MNKVKGKKIKWAKPLFKDLGNIIKVSLGFCQGGASDIGDCQTGILAGSHCGTGGQATVGCDVGGLLGQ